LNVTTDEVTVLVFKNLLKDLATQGKNLTI